MSPAHSSAFLLQAMAASANAALPVRKARRILPSSFIWASPKGNSREGKLLPGRAVSSLTFLVARMGHFLSFVRMPRASTRVHSLRAQALGRWGRSGLISQCGTVRSLTQMIESRATAFAKCRRIFVACGCVLAGTLVSRKVHAISPKSDVHIVQQAMRLKQSGHLEEAKELLERWVEQSPKSELVAMARADLYLAENNPFWALKVLGSVITEAPPACEARAFAARVQLQQANLDQVEELLGETACEKSEALHVRRLLLLAEVAELRGDSDKASQLVAKAQSIRERYEEDDDRLRLLEHAYDPYRLPLFTFSGKTGMGYASTGMGQAPLDVTTPAQTKGSAVGNLQLQGRLTLPFRPNVRPIVELELSAVQHLTDTPRDLSVRQPLARVGALFGRGYPRLQLNYAYELVDFDGVATSSFASGWYSSAHRGEYRWELGPGWLGFGNVGYRQFLDSRRSRVESEHGLVKDFTLTDTLAVGMGASLRAQRAQFSAFDLVGATGFLSLTVQATRGFQLNESVSLSHDRYPGSYGFYSPNANAREDLRLSVSAQILSPAISNFRFALSYRYASRDSSVNAYDYSDHLALLELRYFLTHDDVRAKRISSEGRIPLHHEQETPKALEPETRSVRDALRQDDELRRGSSCLK